MSGWMVYLVLRLDIVVMSVLGVLITAGALVAFAAMFSAMDGRFEGFSQHKLSRVLAGVVVVAFILVILIPNTKQACIIYVLPKVANNEQVQQIPEKLLDIANGWLDEQLSDFGKKQGKVRPEIRAAFEEHKQTR